MGAWLALPPATQSLTTMDLQKTLDLLAAKGDHRHTATEALVVLYQNEEAGAFETHISGDLVGLKRMLLSYAKTNSFFRKIVLDTADSIRIHQKGGVKS